MKKGPLVIIASIILLMVFSLCLSIQAVPKQINYQGKLTDGDGNALTGNYNVSFYLYNIETDGMPIWSENQNVTVTDGIYNIQLGAVNPLLVEIFGYDNIYLEVKIEGNTLSPRQRLTSTAFAMNAGLIDGQKAIDIIDAASDEVRTPISSLPYSINSSGSYYVTRDLCLSSTGSAINITVDNVTIDLMGFSLSGSPTLYGIGINLSDHSNVEVKNGTITKFDYGIHGAKTDAGKGNRIINLRVIDSKNEGIYLKGTGHLIKDCTVSDNKSIGIYISAQQTQREGVGSLITGNTVYNNGWHGIMASSGSLITGNAVFNNGQCGILGSSDCMIADNLVKDNNQSDTENRAGIYVNNDCQVKGNRVSGNKQNNILLWYTGNVIEENYVTDSENGINFNNTGGGLSANNRARGNTTDYANAGGIIDGGGNFGF